jgi:hypothetical protein
VGAVFQVGQQMVRPGFYFRVVNSGGNTLNIPQGIVAALCRSSWGPVGEVQTFSSDTTVEQTFGTNGTANEMIEQVFLGGAAQVEVIRMGEDDGVGAAITLVDTTSGTAVQAVKLTLSVGEDGNNYSATVRDSLTDSNLRQLVIYNGQTVAQTFTFAKGATGTGEPAALVAAVTAMNLNWITATKLADGNKTLASVTQTEFSGGQDPTVDPTAISNALDTLSSIDWNVLCIDSEDPSVHATVQAYIDSQWNLGKLVQAVVGEATDVELSTRQSDCRIFNDYLVSYVLNGFEDSNGNSIEGYLAAARVAGMIAAMNLTDSLTHAVVVSASDIVGNLANQDIINSLNAGAILFTKNSQKQVQVEYGINTYISPDADYDAGWHKIRRVNTRIYLMSEIAAAWDPLVGKVNNDSVGQSTLIAAAKGVINQMVKAGALLDGTVGLDPDNLAVGDSAWFTYAVDDIDSAEKLYGTFGFEFSPPTNS